MLATRVPILLQGYDAERTTFLNQIRGVLGKNAVACYLPHRNDTLTSIDPISARAWTADATMAGQITPLGKGSQRAFNGTTNYLTTPDTTDLSFGNGTTDTPFTIFVVANVTDTATARTFLSKFDTANQEWWFTVGGTADQLFVELVDQSVPVAPTRLETAAIAQGSWNSFSMTYSAATGGATATNDVTFYQNGVVVASTPTNQATYVAMENLAAAVEVGSTNAHTANFFQGSLAMVLLIGANLSLSQHLTLTNISKSYFTI